MNFLLKKEIKEYHDSCMLDLLSILMIFTDIIEVFLISATVRHQQVFMCVLAMKLVTLGGALGVQGLFAAPVTVHFLRLTVFAIIVLYVQLDYMLKTTFAMLVLQVCEICEKHKYTCF